MIHRSIDGDTQFNSLVKTVVFLFCLCSLFELNEKNQLEILFSLLKLV